MALKTVLVTGATSGIGRATCKLFAEKCGATATIIPLGRRQHLLDEVATEIEGYGAKALPLACDVADAAAVGEALRPIASSIDILVNNAGLALGGEKLQDGDPSNWDKMIDVNTKGLLYVTQAVLPSMVEQVGW